MFTVPNANNLSEQKIGEIEKIVSLFEGRYIDLSDGKCFAYDVETRIGTTYLLFQQQINTLSAEYKVEIESNETNTFLSIQEKATNHEAVKITLRKASLMERIKYVMYLNAIL